jgi:Predicted membrane protein
MLLMYCRFGMSLFSVSVAGGIVHNIGQLLIAMAVVENLNLIYYAPVLLISGALTGLVIGVLSNVLLPVMKKAFHRLD